jgi:hypothetical protein
MTSSRVIPSPNRSLPPPFHELDADTFGELSCALYEKESQIRTSDLYRIRGQKQYGIDVIAHRADGADIEVASCKCYKQIKKGEIRKWSDDFLDHWDDHWKSNHVIRFVLAVSVDVRAAQLDKEVIIERDRFKQLGVVYEIWGPRQLQERLRPHPELVSHYLGFEWIERICGQRNLPSFGFASPSTGPLSAQVVAQISELQAALGEEVEHRLDSALDD